MKPNVIFVITHDVGPVYGCYGNTLIHSPNIDRLAGESVRFDRHYCQWPLCGPSRASLFSGLRPMSTRRFNNEPFFAEFRGRAPSGFATLPEQFGNAGYRCFGTGWIYHDEPDGPSWNAGHRLPDPNPGPVPDWADGWLDADGLYEWKAPQSRELVRQRLEAARRAGMTMKEFRTLAGERVARGPAVESADVSDDAYYDGKVAAQARAFLTDHPIGEPYFLGVGFVAPHTPFRAPKRYWDLYRREDMPLPESRVPPVGSAEWMEGDSEPAQYYTTHGYTRPWRADEFQLRELLHGHYATISYIDALLGSILDEAKRRSDWEETIVVFTSDHGYSEGHHGYWGKHNLWDATLHVPLLIRPAAVRVPAEAAVGTVTEHVDMYPTVCELAGVSVPEFLNGTSRAKAVTGETVTPAVAEESAPRGSSPMPPRDGETDRLAETGGFAVSHRKHMWHDRLQVYDIAHSIRSERYRYTEYLGTTGARLGEELFDYENDPLETKNHVEEPDYAAAKEELRRRLHGRLEAT